ncbi:MAG: fatty acid CoA ligase family protein [Victivallaceae bacterium]|jgi:acyl-CoA synthetase (AMP-forming)/AMP-acid ligase II
MMNNQLFNISRLLTEAAGKYEDREALFAPRGRGNDGNFQYSVLTFRQLENLVNAYALAFSRRGIVRNTRVLMLLKPGLEFAAAVFAVYKTGAVPVLIDPGMGTKNLLGCIRQTLPEAVIAISPAHWVRLLFRKHFPCAKIFFSLGKFPPPGCERLEDVVSIETIRHGLKFDFETANTTLDDTAAIVFTTGSTGPPKGVVYTHRTFKTQVELIREVYGAGPDYIDMSAFPLFALFAVILGMPSVIPQMDFTRPARVNPENIIRPVLDKKISFSFGSPALWRTVSQYCIANNIRLPSLKKVLMAGAPVTAELHRAVKQIIAADGEIMVPYGATEALPVANFTGGEMLAETAVLTARGKGYCVGYPNPGIDIRVITPAEGEIKSWSDQFVLPPAEIGEIVVRGDVVKKEYFNNPRHNLMSTITDAGGVRWHRMGDMGYFDAKGRLWFCGRKNHRVITPERTYYSVCSEAIFNQHPDVSRTALTGVNSRPVLFIEPRPGKFPENQAARTRFISELKELGQAYPFTSGIQTFLFHRSFPVDIRHNAKIFREKLAILAAKTLKS